MLLGRLQIFNNWSPYMVADPTKVWIGLEYFCYETDALWTMPDEELKKFAVAESGEDRDFEDGGGVGCARGAGAEDLSGVLWDL